MQLIKLMVLSGSGVVREIVFKDGINIITNKGSDGNQIGKSTALRVINFCLGSDGVSIWKDPDTNRINDKVYQFVTSGGVEFSLEILVNNERYLIRRKVELQVRKKLKILRRISWINDEQYDSVDKFKVGIAKIFGYEVEKPSFSSVKNRFVRLDKASSNKIYKYQNMYVSDDQYTLIYSHLFGFEGHSELTN